MLNANDRNSPSNLNHASGSFRVAISRGSTKRFSSTHVGTRTEYCAPLTTPCNCSRPISVGCPVEWQLSPSAMVPFQDVINGQKAKSSTSRCAGGLDMTCAEGLPDFAAVQDGACLCSWF
ncbi:hypothetical protein M431DRAFT_90508 [Trichoderma harzianum CBS 226.95]|uniref:Uncharacterized protein n=1 Tax=Trichoderma harzianum CBS 226.95 TaxID=983964 RepID=A0A2T4A6F5_TRIHA|nr:hypothetical protein M431DRAFT_90508 [Trichoderma harzianum CBS 226.95]PTB52631.1 hypothetical protein M431DRAFT_90508 [Trichoderma harzianum CBS 226.95]